jgi:hypothetical protein
MNLAAIAILQRDFARAQGLLEGQLERARAAQFDWGMANCLTMLGHIACEQQQYALARSRYRESLAVYRTLGNQTYAALCLEGIAALAGAEGHDEQAARLCAHAAALRRTAQTPLPQREQHAFDSVVATARAALGEERFAAVWEQGSVLTPEEGVACALASIGEAHSMDQHLEQ